MIDASGTTVLYTIFACASRVFWHSLRLVCQEPLCIGKTVLFVL